MHKKGHNEISISSTKQVLIIHPSCPTFKLYRIIVFFKKHIKTKFITFHIYHIVFFFKTINAVNALTLEIYSCFLLCL